MGSKIKSRYIMGIIALVDIVCLTGIYYYWWRIGYTHGIPGYPEYYGMGKFILMVVYGLLTGIIACFSGGFMFRRLKVLNVMIRQCCVMVAVNTITYLQLSLTATGLVAKRPLFDATVTQFVFILVYVAAVDLVLRRRHTAGRMLVIGDGVGMGDLIDGYLVDAVEPGGHGMTELTELLGKTDGYDAVLSCGKDETTAYIIRHCLDKRIPIYTTSKDPLTYGVSRMRDDGTSYILVLGVGNDEGRFFDRVRAFLT